MTRTPLRRLTTSLIAVLALVACLLPSTPAASRPVIAAKPTPGSSGAGDAYFPLYGNGGYNVLHYGLDVRYDPKTDILTGRATLKIRADKSLSRFDLDLVGLTVRSITVDGRSASWTRRADHELVITPIRALGKRHVFVVVVRYDGKPRRFSDPNLGTYGFLTTDDGAIAVGEPEVAAFWYPVDDHPKDKATYSIKLTVPRGLQAISNGLPSKTRYSTKGGKRWASTAWTEKHPMASYLAFMAVGHFTIHRWHTASGLPVIDAVDPSLVASVRGRINSSFAKQGKILAAESRWFGRYPFEAAGGVVDKVDVGFALENQTRPTYSSDFWSFSDDPADSDYVVVHELAHQWYGDSVSLRRWADVWLNEGFATYAEWLWLEKTTTATPQDIADEIYREFPAGDGFWKVPPGAPGRNAVFDAAVYERGAMALQALRQAVGKTAFFKILQAWPRVHADGHGTTRQFIALSEKISGRQLDALFQAWLFSPTKPAAAPAPNSTLDSRNQTPHERAVHADIERWRHALDGRLSHGAR